MIVFNTKSYILYLLSKLLVVANIIYIMMLFGNNTKAGAVSIKTKYLYNHCEKTNTNVLISIKP
jgi:hypothetical protein